MRSLASLVLAATVAGCALSDGDPWGEADVGVEAAFAPPADRRTAEGWLRTSTSYGIELETVELAFDAVTVGLRPLDAEGPAAFDPANPPEGYSLCHGGHCHAADGRLVSYEEIAAELAGGSGDAGLSLAIGVERPVELAADEPPAAVPLAGCDGPCWLPRGELASLSLPVHAIRVKGIVHDLLPEERRRLPAEGVPVEFLLEPEAAFGAPLAGAVDEGEPVGVGIDARFDLTPALFDGVDWAAVLAGPAGLADPDFRSSVAENLAASTLTATVRRFER